MKKKVISVLLAGVTAMSLLAGCGLSSSSSTSGTSSKSASTSSSAASTSSSSEYKVNDAAAKDPKVTLTMAEVNPVDGTICGAMDTKFKEAVEAMSGGSITIDLQGGGVLGSEDDIIKGMTGGTGTVDISRISAFALNNYGAKKSVLLSLPYTFNDRDHFWKFAESDLGQEFLDESEEQKLGVRGLYYGEEGFRDFFTVKDKPIEKPEDMKGMKIRVSKDPIMTKMVAALGATASPMDMSEVYSSLQNGTIDGAEQPVVNYASNKFEEVGPNLTLDGHTLGAMMTIITDSAYNKLTDNQQQVIQDAGKIASQYCREYSEQQEKKTLDELKSEGIKIIEVKDKTPWQQACKSIADEYAGGDLADTYQQILDMGK